MTTETAAVAAGQDRQQRAISAAARHLYEAETALHTARQSGVAAWISAAYDRLSEAIADHMRAVAALQAGAEPPF
jgi:vacuolar-type H+-ATPase subunit E/Vma4